MSRVFPMCWLLLFCLLWQGTDSEASQPGSPRIGNEACGSCHPKQLRAWKAGPHANAGRSLPVGSERKCERCHGSRKTSILCEDCHGGGADYSAADIMGNRGLAMSLGLKSVPGMPLAVQCVRCHTSATTIGTFDANAAWKKIAH